MVKLVLPQKKAHRCITGQSKVQSGKPVFCDTANPKVGSKEEQHILNTAQKIIRLNREALQELEKY